MTTPDDRIATPTNGHHAASATVAEATPGAGRPDTTGPTLPTPSDLRIAVSPAQAAAGFGIIAALILLLVRGRRGKGARGDRG
jgi:hypothetical protein